MSRLANVPGEGFSRNGSPTRAGTSSPDLSPSPGTYFVCESCRLRPFQVIDTRWGPEFAVCTSCYEGAIV